MRYSLGYHSVGNRIWLIQAEFITSTDSVPEPLQDPPLVPEASLTDSTFSRSILILL